MCGIAGLCGTGSAPSRRVRDELEAMMARVAPPRARRPRACTSTGRSASAHARLSIIDLASGAQPLCQRGRNASGSSSTARSSTTSSCAQDAAAPGHVFRTRIRHRGARPPVRRARRRASSSSSTASSRSRCGTGASSDCVLARDRVGIRPLFYTWRRSGGCAFASEVKALFALPEVPRRLDADGARVDLQLLVDRCRRHSAFEGIEQLPPGHR